MIKSLKKTSKRWVNRVKKKETKPQKKIHKIMKEFSEGKLHSGFKKGPIVKNKDQAIAIAMHESRQSKKK